MYHGRILFRFNRSNTLKKMTLGALCSATFLAAGCDNKAESGALIGAGGGAVAGGLIGSASHARAGEGALIGGAAGAIGGALLGHGLDESDRKQQARLDAQSREYDERTNTVGTHGWSSSGNADVSKTDVISWSNQGLRDDIIIDRIDRSDAVFHLTAADQNDLRDQGVSEAVIHEMKSTARR